MSLLFRHPAGLAGARPHNLALVPLGTALTLLSSLLLPAQVGRRMARPEAPAADVPPVKPEERCAIDGVVLNAVTGEPLARAQLVLRRVDRPQDASGSTTSDSAGKFAVKDLEPGRYRFFVSRNGYVQQEYGSRKPGRPGTILSLEKSQKISGLAFRLTPHGVLSGRIADEEGEPMARVAMSVLRAGYMGGRRRWTPAGFAETNDLGEYRIFGLGPGKYYLSATYRAGFMMAGTVDRSASESGGDESYVPYYFPGVTDSAAAQLLEVTPGGHLRGMDMTLRRTATVRVRGRVTNAAVGSRRGVQLFLVPRRQIATTFPNAFSRTLDAQGNFEIRGVAPGSYILAADFFDEGKRLSARVPLEVGGSHVENVMVTLSPGAELSGRIRVDGQQKEADWKGVQVMLEAQEQLPMSGGNAGRAKEDGTFTITNLPAERFTMRVNGLPPGFYVKSARFGDDDVLARGVELSPGVGGALELVVSPAAAKLEGLVVDENQQPVTGVTVVLVPEESRRAQAYLWQSTTTDQTGRYSFAGVAPGDYLVMAFEDLEPGAERDPEFVKPFERSGEKVSLKESGSESKQVKLIPAGSGT